MCEKRENTRKRCAQKVNNYEKNGTENVKQCGKAVLSVPNGAGPVYCQHYNHSESVAQNPAMPVRAGTKKAHNSGPVWNLDGTARIGPRPFPAPMVLTAI